MDAEPSEPLDRQLAPGMSQSVRCDSQEVTSPPRSEWYHSPVPQSRLGQPVVEIPNAWPRPRQVPAQARQCHIPSHFDVRSKHRTHAVRFPDYYVKANGDSLHTKEQAESSFRSRRAARGAAERAIEKIRAPLQNLDGSTIESTIESPSSPPNRWPVANHEPLGRKLAMDALRSPVRESISDSPSLPSREPSPLLRPSRDLSPLLRKRSRLVPEIVIGPSILEKRDTDSTPNARAKQRNGRGSRTAAQEAIVRIKAPLQDLGYAGRGQPREGWRSRSRSPARRPAVPHSSEANRPSIFSGVVVDQRDWHKPPIERTDRSVLLARALHKRASACIKWQAKQRELSSQERLLASAPGPEASEVALRSLQDEEAGERALFEASCARYNSIRREDLLDHSKWGDDVVEQCFQLENGQIRVSFAEDGIHPRCVFDFCVRDVEFRCHTQLLSDITLRHIQEMAHSANGKPTHLRSSRDIVGDVDMAETGEDPADLLSQTSPRIVIPLLSVGQASTKQPVTQATRVMHAKPFVLITQSSHSRVVTRPSSPRSLSADTDLANEADIEAQFQTSAVVSPSSEDELDFL